MTRYARYKRTGYESAMTENSNSSKNNANAPITRDRHKICFNCRQRGHSVAACPQSKQTMTSCYKCGALNHTSKQCPIPGNDYKHATCFVCQQTGHLASQCPENEKGLYPFGGGCRYCGSVRHLAKDCKPTRQEEGRTVLGKQDQTQGGDDDDVFVALKRKATTETATTATALKKTKVIHFTT